MNNTVIYNNVGKTLVVDKIIERKSKHIQTQTQKEQYCIKASLLANYSKLQNQLLTYVSDNYLTAIEKQQLRKEMLSIDSAFSSLRTQAQELKFNLNTSEYNSIYQDYFTQYTNLKNYINPYLETNEPESIDSSIMQTKLSNYYNSVSTLEKKIFEVLYGSTKTIDIELTSEFFVFKKENIPAYEPQIIKAYIKTWDSYENCQFYIDNTLKEISDQGIVEITLNDIQNKDKLILKLLSDGLETIKEIRKVFNGEDSYDIQILSSDGNAFRVGKARTELSALVFKGDKDITASIDASLFSWKRKSNAEPIEDARWNTSSKAIGKKTITITPEDTIGRTIFSCEIDI
ncbi:MAG: hypothetical protein EOL97_06710 [Spirochaetia bacterium]|nr:hypothetical protein [Spirochaetia bacterium]